MKLPDGVLEPSRRTTSVLTSVLVGAVVALMTAFLVANLRPWLWFTDTTPTGGDLGAHVWAPAYLRDVLIGELRLTGWTHDWYAGFPAFTFYMVVPSLLVVVVDAGLGLHEAVFAHLAVALAAGAAALVVARRAGRSASQCWAIALVVAGVAGAAKLFVDAPAADRALAALLLPAAVAWCAWYGLRRRPYWRAGASAVAALLALVVVPMPYGVSLKLVTIAGVVVLPAAVWAMTRLGGIGAEGQALASVATLLFLFDRSFNIYGGNLMSTMAGEFAYSLGLATAVLYIGVAVRGMQTDRHRILAGALLALTGLMHLFSAFFALAAVAALLLVLPWRAAEWRRRLVWTVSSGALAAALSAWWVLPFWWNRGLLNDMGWGKERRYLSSLWSRSSFDYSFLENDPPLQLFVVLAAAGAVLLFFRRDRLGMVLALTGAIVAAGFLVLPEGRLWNVRILPFYYLTVYLTAALGIGEAIRTGRSALDRRQAARVAAGETDEDAEAVTAGEAGEADEGAGAGRFRVSAGAIVASGSVVVMTAAVLVMVGLPLRSLPFGNLGDDGVYRWGPFSSSESNLGPYWVEYNFEGYEGRGPTAAGGGSSEYWDLVATMDRIGESRGCGPALWEYESGRLGSYGTPMAPMLLPYWTDRCIASMEGLYFEASATVPYHFLMQSELSSAPSRAQRDLPYSGLDVAAGIEHLRLMGVRYYMAFSEDAVSQARASADLTEVGATPLGPWVVFEVSGHAPAVGLSRLPVVVDGLDDSSDEWLEASVGAFLAAGRDGPVLAADGPDGWPRMTLPDVRGERRDDPSGAGLGRQQVMRRLSDVLVDVAPVENIEPAAISGLVRGDHSISFSVDRVGSPVLVRTSYFPNWSVSGAQGPYRVTPNFMVVVPTGTEVRLTYGRSPVEWFSMAVTLVGLAAVVWLLARRP
ncbi:MAG: hypothetical protein OXG40_06375 [Acidimicrobiaceae bacterium]|nr:hypothetical protein [Acidimicrobiaceae bacterium]MDE0517348.1 hypothetical protein [Acidimicrobiaceae bacterium]